MTSPSARVFSDGGDVWDMIRADREAKNVEFTSYGTCAECKRGPRNLTSRGLCSVCGAKPEVRAKHPSRFELEMLERGETLAQAGLRRYYEANRAGSWGLTNDPFISGRFADGLPGTHAMICPMEGMYSQPEHREEQA